ncbi:peptidyl-tRNA hydrolase ICT1, mitochondrial [Diabrotica virgifera virgifera]|uniref:Large ribosomal subunit protein mL62 n=1 Tax=Diabrotica virgifera virgifera TaxID=50390 RepID=A0A6P7GFU2_DIAVI|nr:peptidyl-tRNA hydrolase ICT1, mitochondrial [Diabrotica virgifera virgifera]
MNIFKRGTIELIQHVKIYNLFQSTQVYRPVTSYKSALSLEHLYPNSTLKITTPQPPSSTNEFTGYIPMEELDITYSRSSGPGGQNVNKVNTKVDIRFHLQSAKWLNEKTKQKIAEKFSTQLTKEGYLIFRSDITRSQQLNLADCLEKIRKAVRGALMVPAEPSVESQERARRRLERAAKERLMVKREKSQVKHYRNDSNIVV